MQRLPAGTWLDAGVFGVLALIMVLAYLRLDGLFFGSVVVLGVFVAATWYCYRWLQSFLGRNRVVDPATVQESD